MAAAMRLAGLVALGSSLSAWSYQLRVEQPTIAAPKDGAYFWAEGHGSVGSYGGSPFVGPTDLQNSLAWTWTHPDGRYSTLPYGTAIDGKKNIYVTTDTSLWKLSPAGKALWSFTPTPRATLFSAGSLLGGRVHFTTLDGRIWAVDMETGKEIWQTKVCDHLNHDNGYVSAHDGVVVAATDASDANERGANGFVRAVNASDGTPLWSYRPQMPIWNFMASFPGDGTLLYQDLEGRSYRHESKTGKLIWKAGGSSGSWTDGSPLLGSNGIFYSVQAFMDRYPGSDPAPGAIEARRVSDGSLLWTAGVPMPPNNAPAFGTLAGRSSPSVVQPGGYQGTKGGPTGIWAYDAATGEKQWSFTGPSQKSDHQAGDLEGTEMRLQHGASGGYVTNPWSAAIIDAAGTVYAGHEDGLFFALRDADGDGTVQGGAEVSTYDTGAAFVGSSSPALAPGMLAVASCDSVFVFKPPAA